MISVTPSKELVEEAAKALYKDEDVDAVFGWTVVSEIYLYDADIVLSSVYPQIVSRVLEEAASFFSGDKSILESDVVEWLHLKAQKVLSAEKKTSSEET